MTTSDRTQRLTDQTNPPDSDSALARKMQSAMMPHHLPSSEELELNMRCFPGEKTGGDLFDVIRISEEVLVFLMFDAAAAGMKAILVSAMAKLCFTNHIRQRLSPSAVVDRVNEELLRDVASDLHLTAFFGYLDLHDNELTYCNIGRVRPVIFRREGMTIELLSRHGRGIGKAADGIGGEACTHLGQGDCLVLFTDGFYRLFGGGGSIGLKAGGEFIRSVLSTASASVLMTRIEEKHAASALKSAVEDDISIICAEMLTQSRRNQIKERLGFGVNEIVYLQFINYLEEMDRAASFILSAMDVAGYPDEFIRKMKIVLTELLVNAIVHGNRRDSMKKVVIGHNIDRGRAVISIVDEGEGFDPSIIPDPTLPENLDRPWGRGLFIVRHYVDSISFNTAGNRVTIVKNNTI
ncbi:MAG: ATP-binding protein [Chitinispirillaceae bacterium]|nr:ATP-binding protein [Chitinispirillaceae bacterium]